MAASQQNAAVRRRLVDLLDEMLAAGSTDSGPEETVELDQARIGRLSRMDAMQAQAMSKATSRRRNERILRIRAALKRLDDDHYGYCLRCGEPINPKRLELDPAAALCVECAARAEQPRR